MAKIFIVYAENRADVLARVALLFHRRAVRIREFHMEPAERAEILRITILSEVDQEQAGRLAADLYKLVDVLSVEIADYEHGSNWTGPRGSAAGTVASSRAAESRTSSHHTKPMRAAKRGR